MSERLINLDPITRHRPSPFDAGRKPVPVDPTPENPRARGRPRTLSRIGDETPPKIAKPELERPPMIDNPLLVGMEPATIPTERAPAKRDFARSTVRRVVPAEIDELIGWGLPRFQQRFPRCTAQSIWPTLNLATQGGMMLFVRTESVCGLFVAERTPWEPDLAVYDVFVVKRREAADDERDAIYRAGLDWACEIDAVSYQYGASTGANLDKVASTIGYNYRATGYIKVLR